MVAEIRYNHIQHLLVPQYTTAQNRTMILKIFEKIGDIKDVILEKCRQKKCIMDQIGLFANEANSIRIISIFRTELSKRYSPLENKSTIKFT